MKKMINSQTYFRKMLCMCLLIISVTIFILTVFFYQRYANALTKNLYDGLEKNLEKSARTMSDLNREISQLHHTLLVDSKVIGFSSLKEFHPEENYATYLIVKKFYNINPYVDSLYIYNDMANDAITCGSYLFDLNYCWNYLKRERRASIFPSPLTETKKNVLTFAYPIYADNFDELSGGIFISLNMEKLSEHVLGTGAQNGIVVNDQGTILLSGIEEDSSIDSSTFNLLFSWSQATNLNTGSSLKRFGGREYLCVFYKDSDLNLTFITISPYSEIVKPMKSQRNVSLIVAGCIFLTAILLQYLITKRLYQPLEQITEEFRDSKYAGTADMDEFSLIRHVYEQALNEIKELAEENAFYQPRLKSSLLKGLILGNQDLNQTREQFLKNDWNIPFEGMFISCVFIEHWDDHEILAPVMQTKIGQHLREKLDSLFYIEYIPMATDHVVFLINTIQDIPITFVELVKLLDDAKEELLTEIPVPLTISLDGITNGMEDLNRVYRRVVELKNYRFVLGYNQIIYPGRILELMPVCMTYPGKLADEILSCMLHGKQEDFMNNILEFFSILKQYTYQPASLLYNRLYLDILSQVQNLTTSEESSGISAEALHIPGTLDEGIDILLSIFNQYQERKKSAEQLKDNKHFERIEESRRYIEEHYNDYNLSAGMVAEYLGYSTNYFSRIFKTITGFYINDYIRQIRIVKAQELLIKSDMTVADIAEATGFSNPNYFYSIFKKETGLTPTAYRNVRV